jgi:hypothetical protein
MWFNRPKRRRNFLRQAQVAPYRARRFKNPYFQRTSKRSKLPFAVAGVIIGLLIALTSFFFTAPLFTITSVRVEGVETVNPKEIRQLVEDYLNSSVWLVLKHNNRFLFKEKKLRQKLEKDYFFSSLKISREGHSLAIVLKERVSSFLWLSDGEAYLLDNTGTVIRATSNEEASEIMNPPPLFGVTRDGGLMPETNKILVFKDLEENPITIGASILPEDELKNVRTFFEAMQTADVVIERFELNQSVGKWLKAITQSGYSILIDPTGNVLKQADSLLLLLREQIKDPAALEYIDVRFGDRVYYK